jgi:hypothetical protein
MTFYGGLFFISLTFGLINFKVGRTIPGVFYFQWLGFHFSRAEAIRLRRVDFFFKNKRTFFEKFVSSQAISA